MATTQTKTRSTSAQTDRLLKLVLNELKSLRKEFSVAISPENLAEYSHPRRIKRSYERALRSYPIQ